MDTQEKERKQAEAKSQAYAEEIISGLFVHPSDETPEPVDSHEHGGMGWLLG